jgi:hypothetical protein
MTLRDSGGVRVAARWSTATLADQACGQPAERVGSWRERRRRAASWSRRHPHRRGARGAPSSVNLARLDGQAKPPMREPDYRPDRQADAESTSSSAPMWLLTSPQFSTTSPTYLPDEPRPDSQEDRVDRRGRGEHGWRQRLLVPSPKRATAVAACRVPREMLSASSHFVSSRSSRVMTTIRTRAPPES